MFRLQMRSCRMIITSGKPYKSFAMAIPIQSNEIYDYSILLFV